MLHVKNKKMIQLSVSFCLNKGATTMDIITLNMINLTWTFNNFQHAKCGIIYVFSCNWIFLQTGLSGLTNSLVALSFNGVTVKNSS